MLVKGEWLCEVFYGEDVPFVFEGILYFEIKPLLMALGISIHI